MIPTTRDEFIETVKRNLGAPVLRINVDEDQLDGRDTKQCQSREACLGVTDTEAYH